MRAQSHHGLDGQQLRVKQKIIPGPEKKAYGAKHIAFLIFVSASRASRRDGRHPRAGSAFSARTYDLPTAYHYFCEEFENLIRYVFGASDHLASVGQDESDEKELLRSALLSVTHKLYLDALSAAVEGKTRSAHKRKQRKRNDR